MKIINRRARHDYELLDRYEAGISLSGAEVKAIRDGKIDLSRAFVKEINNELFLVNALIDGDSKSRRLLLHKKEILSLISKKEAKKLIFVPIKVYNKQSLIKLEFATAKSKRKHQKRETLKKRDIERDIERELKIS